MSKTLKSKPPLLPIIKPTLPQLSEVQDLLAESWQSGVVTTGRLVSEFEREACAFTGAKYAVATSSCTSGLILATRIMDFPPGSEVIVPSFTFAATAQALLWNGIIPVFCDCLPGTRTLNPEDVARNISAKTKAILPAYIYGLPPDIEALIDLGNREGIPVYFDSAQGLGARYKGRPAGTFGLCEIFSLSPTKVVTAIEGGIILTSSEAIAERARSMRDYGKDPETGEDMIYLGLSARMSELHAAVGLLSLRNIEALVKARLARIQEYRTRLGGLAGVSVQEYPSDRVSSGNYFVLFISDRARRSRDEVYRELKRAGIQTKRYFYPPLHLQTIFRNSASRVSSRMENTLTASDEGLALPLYSHLSDEEFDRVCRGVEGLL